QTVVAGLVLDHVLPPAFRAILSSVVNAGVLDHPTTAVPVVGLCRARGGVCSNGLGRQAFGEAAQVAPFDGGDHEVGESVGSAGECRMPSAVRAAALSRSNSGAPWSDRASRTTTCTPSRTRPAMRRSIGSWAPPS